MKVSISLTFPCCSKKRGSFINTPDQRPEDHTPITVSDFIKHKCNKDQKIKLLHFTVLILWDRDTGKLKKKITWRPQ